MFSSPGGVQSTAKADSLDVSTWVLPSAWAESKPHRLKGWDQLSLSTLKASSRDSWAQFEDKGWAKGQKGGDDKWDCRSRIRLKPIKSYHLWLVFISWRTFCRGMPLRSLTGAPFPHTPSGPLLWRALTPWMHSDSVVARGNTVSCTSGRTDGARDTGVEPDFRMFILASFSSPNLKGASTCARMF